MTSTWYPKNEFLSRLCARARFPEAVMAMAIECFPAYADYFAENPSLGSQARRLFPSNEEETLLDTMLTWGNHEAINIILEKDEISDCLLETLDQYWQLSKGHVARLSAMKVPFWWKDRLPLPHPEKTLDGKSHFCGGPHYANDERYARFAKGVALVKMPEEWLHDDDYLSALGSVLVTEMGLGTEPFSLTQWRHFMGLVDGGIDTSLADLVDAARRLALSEQRV
jgi:hypothetical protein